MNDTRITIIKDARIRNIESIKNKNGIESNATSITVEGSANNRMVKVDLSIDIAKDLRQYLQTNDSFTIKYKTTKYRGIHSKRVTYIANSKSNLEVYRITICNYLDSNNVRIRNKKTVQDMIMIMPLLPLQSLICDPFAPHQTPVNLDFQTRDALFLFTNTNKPDSEKRVKSIIKHQIKNSKNSNGSTLIPINEIVKAASFKFQIRIERVNEVIKAMFDSGELRREKQRFVMTSYDYDTTMQIAQRLIVFNKKDESSDAANIDEVIRDSSKFKLHEKQFDAVKMAMDNQLSIINGGPGTGKSTVVSTIVSSILKVDPYAKIALSSLSGKAVSILKNKITQDITNVDELERISIQTLHSILEYNGSTFGVETSQTSLKYTHFVIDETSMVDEELLSILLKVLSNDTKIIIVGDTNQLPSISPGSVLRDIVAFGQIPVTTLTEVYRQGDDSKLPLLAQAIANNGDLDKLITPQRGMESLDFSRNITFVESFSLNTDTSQIINEYLKKEKVQLTSFLRNSQIIAATKAKDGGVDYCNMVYDNIVVKTNGPKYRKLMSTTNNKNENIVNGDTLLIDKTVPTVNNPYTVNNVKRVPDSVAVEMLGNNEKRMLPYNVVSSMPPAYAITIHKSQGSEYDTVFLNITDSEIMHNKKLIYTAVTRAKTKLVIMGHYDSFKRFCKKEAIARDTLLAELLVGVNSGTIEMSDENRNGLNRESSSAPESDQDVEPLNDNTKLDTTEVAGDITDSKSKREDETTTPMQLHSPDNDGCVDQDVMAFDQSGFEFDFF